MSKKNLMTASFLLLSGLSYANYNVIILKEKNDYVGTIVKDPCIYHIHVPGTCTSTCYVCISIWSFIHK